MRFLVTLSVLVIALVIAGIVYVLLSPPPIRPAGPAWFTPRGLEPKFRLSETQATNLRRALNSHAEYRTSADGNPPAGFFYLDGDTFYWRGRALSLHPESGAHWTWHSKYGEAMDNWRLRTPDGAFNDDSDVREFLRILDRP